MNVLNKFKTLKRSFSNEVFDSAAALSYYFLFAAFPISFLALKATSYFYLTNYSYTEGIHTFIPASIKEALTQISQKVNEYELGAFWGLSLILLSLWSASNLISALIRVFNKIYKKDINQNTSKISIRLRLKEFKVLGLFIFIFLVPNLISFFLEFLTKHSVFQNQIESLLVISSSVFRYLVSLTTPFLFILTLYSISIHNKLYSSKNLYGSFFATLMIFMFSKVFGYYVAEFTDYSMYYGSFATSILFVSWLYILSFSLITGCIINSSLIEKK